MKKNYKQTIKIITLGLLLSAGLGFAFSQPTSSYPANTDAPIDTSTVSQSKGGTPSASLLDVSGLLSSNGLMVFGNAYIFGNNSSGSGTLEVGGLANNSGVTYPALVCADSSGQLTVIGCTTAPTITCGSANGGTFQSQPTSGLCSDGSTPALNTTANGWSWSCGGNSCSATQGTPPVQKTRTYTRNSSGQQIASGDSCANCTTTSFVVSSGMNNVIAEVWGAGGGGGESGAGSDNTWISIDQKTNPGGGGGGGGGYSTGSLSTGSYAVTAGQGGASGIGGNYLAPNTAFVKGNDGQSGGQSSIGGISALGGGGGIGGRIAFIYIYNPSNYLSSFTNINRYPGLGGAGGIGSTSNGNSGITGATSTTSNIKANIAYYLDQYCPVASTGGAGGTGFNGGANGGKGAGGYSGTDSGGTGSGGNQSGSVILAATCSINKTSSPDTCSIGCTPSDNYLTTNSSECCAGSTYNSSTQKCEFPGSGGGGIPYPQCGDPLPATKGQDGKIIITWEE